MVYKQKHIDPPMSLLDLKLRQGGRYAYSYFDMDGYNSTVFSNFYGSWRRDFLSFDDRLDSVHRPKNHHWHPSICRPMLLACSRRLSPFLSGLPLGHQQTLANPDSDAGQTLLSDRHNYHCSGRYAVPPQRKKNQRCRLLARCCSIDKEKHCSVNNLDRLSEKLSISLILTVGIKGFNRYNSGNLVGQILRVALIIAFERQVEVFCIPTRQINRLR